MAKGRPFWADLVDKAIAAAVANGRPPNVERVLNSVGLLHWTPYRVEARTYAVKMLEPAKERGDLTPYVRSLAAMHSISTGRRRSVRKGEGSCRAIARRGMPSPKGLPSGTMIDCKSSMAVSRSDDAAPASPAASITGFGKAPFANAYRPP